MPPINIDRSLVAGVQSNLMETWRQQMPVYRKQQAKLFKFLPDTNIRHQTEVWKESLPFPDYWPYGEPRTIKGFRDRYLEIGKYNYQATITWNKFDADDDQVGDTETHVNMIVQRYGMLPDVLASEYFNGTAVLNRALTNVYDGATLFSATDGDGNDRLGVSGGNLVTGSGTTVDAMIHDFAVVQQRALGMVDPTAGKPIFSPDDVQYTKMFAILPKEWNERAIKAAKSDNLKISDDNMVSETNWIMGLFEWQINQYFTDSSDWYVVIDHPYWKPFVFREPKNPESYPRNFDNSDVARDTGEMGLYTHVRTAIGPWFPGVIFKINN